jgi:prepilin-type N-terminal cleavage/methylation domain-containing protein
MMRKKNAFTLIELLVVIAIIGILAALLIPAVTGALRNAKRVQCNGQVGQIIKSMVLYYEANDLQLPPAKNDTWKPFYTRVGGMEKSTQKLDPNRPLAPYLKNVRIFECPSDRGLSAASSISSVFEYFGSSYLYPCGGKNLKGILNVAPSKGMKITAAALSNTTKKIIIMDGVFRYNDQTVPSGTKDEWHDIKYLSAVCGFLDGHVAFTRSKGYSTPDKDDNDYY